MRDRERMAHSDTERRGPSDPATDEEAHAETYLADVRHLPRLVVVLHVLQKNLLCFK